MSRCAAMVASACPGVVTASHAASLIVRSDASYLAIRSAVIDLPGISQETLFVVEKRTENAREDAEGDSSGLRLQAFELC